MEVQYSMKFVSNTSATILKEVKLHNYFGEGNWFLLLASLLIVHSSPQKQAAKKDVYQLFAEKVRDHKDLVSRWAVLQETRVEYFRGKDFVSFLRNHPEIKEVLESDRGLEAEDIANTLLKENLMVRCDRVVKTVRPGKKKLSTWPAHLGIFPVSWRPYFQ